MEFRRKDPELLSVAVTTLIRFNNSAKHIAATNYDFIKIMADMSLRRLTVENAVNMQLEDIVTSVDVRSLSGGGNENPTTDGDRHICGFNEKIIEGFVFRKHVNIVHRQV